MRKPQKDIHNLFTLDTDWCSRKITNGLTMRKSRCGNRKLRVDFTKSKLNGNLDFYG